VATHGRQQSAIHPQRVTRPGLNLVAPLWVYDHDAGDAAITGGFVYRGSSMPRLSASMSTRITFRAGYGR